MIQRYTEQVQRLGVSPVSLPDMLIWLLDRPS
ncbi:hypothetical protein E2C01_100024 [Portunus trituberculatus]|uniref:Uncharacterized protein n=1 Tax=Portunus trituberculatus TaxID=210409 RepID=A0A5B7K6Y8_PORTR|nr:hypothetical protein [Portunus trituberculatus]